MLYHFLSCIKTLPICSLSGRLFPLFQGKTVEVFSLNSVKTAMQSEEVTLEQCEIIPDGCTKLPVDEANTV